MRSHPAGLRTGGKRDSGVRIFRLVFDGERVECVFVHCADAKVNDLFFKGSSFVMGNVVKVFKETFG
jgi:hypothetical protein